MELITVKEAAVLLDVTPRMVTKLCNNNKISGVIKKGRSWFLPKDEVTKLIKPNPKKIVLPCPVGKTSFADVCQSCYYVDKTGLIKEILDESNQVILFTRPRRFGKTLALNMLKCFFENRDNAKFFVKLNIWKQGKIYQEQQGKFPVIYLSFKDIKFNNWADTMEGIKLTLKDEFQRHSYLENSVSLDDIDKEFYRRSIKMQLSEVEYTKALLHFTRILSKHFHSKVMIMIDEYDTPIQQGYLHGFYDEIIGFTRNLFSNALKDNLFLERGFLTGILRISKENLFSGLNNITVNTILDNHYSEYFGFTVPEVEQMALYYGKQDKLTEIKSWFDGYRFGTTDIYNPWSVTNYFSEGCVAKAFWANTSENGIIKQTLFNASDTVTADLKKMLVGDVVNVRVDLNIIYPKIKTNKSSVYSFLLLTGYLKAVQCITDDVYQLTLPNNEVRSIYRKEILDWLDEASVSNAANDIRIAILTNDFSEFQNLLEKYMLASASFMDTSTEAFYHGLVLGLVAIVSDRYFITSNREAGYGRFDLQLEPKNADMPAILMEFKTCEEICLDEQSEAALGQIMMKRYYQTMLDKNCKIICCGIAFSGKRCKVKSSLDSCDKFECKL